MRAEAFVCKGRDFIQDLEIDLGLFIEAERFFRLLCISCWITRMNFLIIFYLCSEVLNYSKENYLWRKRILRIVKL